ncbi:prepilin peptidase [Candidatus Parcubacteria bacterium]|nr:prepilin peptidase [Candidatus Parcubacteria bacterium]
MFLFYIIIFIFGLAVGSFLNVVIFRLENGEKIVNDRSKCLHCKHILAWYDLIPVLSFIFLRGRCRYCGERISWQYPLVELGTGTLFLLIFNFSAQGGPASGWQFLPLLFWFYIVSSLTVIFIYDLKHYIIPDKIIYPAIIVTFIYKLFEIWNFGHWNLFGILNLPAQGWSALGGEIGNLIIVFNSFIAAIFTSAFFLSIVLLTRGRGMGGGDVKLGFLMGLILGWPLVLAALFLSSILGSMVGIFLIFIGKKKMKSMIPFGPFLVLGTFIALFWGERIVEWYLNMII